MARSAHLAWMTIGLVIGTASCTPQLRESDVRRLIRQQTATQQQLVRTQQEEVERLWKRVRKLEAANLRLRRELKVRPPVSGRPASRVRRPQLDRAAILSGIRKVGVGRYEITARAARLLAANTASLARDASLFPVAQGGFKLARVRPGGVIAALGFRNGDVLHTMVGIRLTGVDKMLEAYTRLARATAFTVGIRRAGRSVTLHYRVR